MPVGEWERAWAEANDVAHPRPGEWVTFIPGEHMGIGLTLPDDAAPIRRLSLVGPPEWERIRLSIGFVEGTDLEWSAGGIGHCGLPVRGRCDAGLCGSCRLCRRYADPPGLVCICDHGS
jgi:hypothetical protein